MLCFVSKKAQIKTWPRIHIEAEVQQRCDVLRKQSLFPISI